MEAHCQPWGGFKFAGWLILLQICIYADVQRRPLEVLLLSQSVKHQQKTIFDVLLCNAVVKSKKTTFSAIRSGSVD